MYKEGDRIRLVSMPDDPHPVEPGTEGTVIDVVAVNAGWAKDRFTQLHVKWDNGRNLSCVCPPDIVQVLPAAVPV